MFKFGFSNDNEYFENVQVSQHGKKCEEVEIALNLDDENIFKIENVKSVELSKVVLKHLSDGIKQLQTFEETSILKAEQEHSDLLPAIYEGGLKIWECTYDMLNLLDTISLDLDNKFCLDLGCGSGLIGIYCLHQGGKCIFQDYNTDVIKYLTIPNIKLNQDSTDNCKFYSGDWESFNECLPENMKFDYIFTSETIYNTESYPKLHNVFKNFLKMTGVIFLAAKSYYFGVGGGIALFQKYIDENKIFKYETCWENSEGLKRKILKITFI